MVKRGEEIKQKRMKGRKQVLLFRHYLKGDIYKIIKKVVEETLRAIYLYNKIVFLFN